MNYVSHPSRNMFGMIDDKFHFLADGETVLLWTEIKQKHRTASGERVTLDRRIILQNVLTEEISREWYFRSGQYQLAMHPSETQIAIFERDAMRLHIEDLYSGEVLSSWTVSNVVRAMEFHPSGKWLVFVD